jgi:hypothetical protein
MVSTRSLVTSNISKQANEQSFYLEEHKDKGYVTLKLNRAPVNSLSLEILTALNIQLEKIETSKDFNGVILTSVGFLELNYNYDYFDLLL